MARQSLMIAVFFMVVIASPARGQDSTDLKMLKDRIELLETKLKLAEKENELLRKENEGLKAKDPKSAKEATSKKTLSDYLPESTVVKGDYIWKTGDKHGGEISLTIKERDGAKFKGLHVAKAKLPLGKSLEEFRVEIEGEVNGDRISYKPTGTTAKFSVVGFRKGDIFEATMTTDTKNTAKMTFKLNK